MLTSLDHVRIRASEPARSAADCEALLGAGSRAADGHLSVGTTGVEFVACQGGAEVGDSEPEDEGVDALVFSVDSLDDFEAYLREQKLGFARSAADTGRLVLARAATGGVALEIVEAPPRTSVATSRKDGAQRLDHAVVITAAHDRAVALYRDVLGLRLALDRSFEKRGLRILFFRLAGVTIEVAGPLGASGGLAEADAVDHFGGLAWRGSDVVAWRERLLREGFEVSAHRAGFKPGTRVCTVASRCAGVPTLLIGDEADASST